MTETHTHPEGESRPDHAEAKIAVPVAGGIGKFRTLLHSMIGAIGVLGAHQQQAHAPTTQHQDPELPMRVQGPHKHQPKLPSGIGPGGLVLPGWEDTVPSASVKVGPGGLIPPNAQGPISVGPGGLIPPEIDQ